VLAEQGMFSGRTVNRNNQRRLRKVLLWTKSVFKNRLRRLGSRLSIRGVAPHPRLSVHTKPGIFYSNGGFFL
jgi:hypothetical protein